jgi:hypothetical protein
MLFVFASTPPRAIEAQQLPRTDDKSKTANQPAQADGGWPRYYTTPGGASIVVYTPQIASWQNQKDMVLYAAVAYTPMGATKASFGTVKAEATGNTTRAVRTSSGDVYAGRDGNVYRNQNGSWQKYNDGSWNNVQRQRPNQQPSSTLGQLNRDSASRFDGAQRTWDSGNFRSGGFRDAGSFRPSGGFGGGGFRGGGFGGGGFRGGGRR